MTSLLITAVDPQAGSSSVADTTTFGVLVIIGACGGAEGPVNTARNSSYERRPYRWRPESVNCGITARLISSS